MNLFQKTLFTIHGFITLLLIIFGMYLILGLLWYITNLNLFLFLIPIYLIIDVYKHFVYKKLGYKIDGLTYKKKGLDEYIIDGERK
jgi:hypothetical protein